MTSHKKYLGLALLLAFSAFAQVDTSSIQMFETLDEVEIDRDPGVRLSKKSVLSKELISEVELRKAASRRNRSKEGSYFGNGGPNTQCHSYSGAAVSAVFTGRRRPRHPGSVLRRSHGVILAYRPYKMTGKCA